MPRRKDLQKIMIIGSGPIVIGQASEFDYSGTQAVKALKEEGYEILLINSNPATIMTDPDLADKIYIEPISLPYLEKIIKEERPQAILPTVGGQTALNAALLLYKEGILDKYNIELIGAKPEAIEKAEDRELFKQAMEKINVKVPLSVTVKTYKDALKFLKKSGLPIILRPSFTLGGTGGGICYNKEDFETMVLKALAESPTHQVLIEQSVLGWKEFELEVMRDLADNVVIICSIENLDPMGVHTGDSITVAPQQTLSDKEYQNLRNIAINVIREIGVETGGSNIQFAVNPKNGDVIIIEMNPRVSRSSALASKATGFPIARIAAKLSVGYTLDEIPNDITKKTPASFEPSIDYIVTKAPRFTFEKFPDTPRTLDTQMRSVGEAMAIGRTFGESFHKVFRSLETGRGGWGLDFDFTEKIEILKQKKNNTHSAFLRETLSIPTDNRIFYLREAMLENLSNEEIYSHTKIDPWFITQLRRLIDLEKLFKKSYEQNNLDFETFEKTKQFGYTNLQLACLISEEEINPILIKLADLKKGSEEYNLLSAKIKSIVKENKKLLENKTHKWEKPPVYKRVDTCAAEFESFTPYLYSSYEEECEAEPDDTNKVIILGGGPNRIGQGIEFDYCCCHASFALQEMGYESIMVNSNPETVSTDYDTSNRLYFEPLTIESILSIYEKEKLKGSLKGVILQFGGQTPLRLARELLESGVIVLGTSPADIHKAEDRNEFNKMIKKLNLNQPLGAMAISLDEALAAAEKIGYPVLARPSYVLGGRAMMIVHNPEQLKDYMEKSTELSQDRPVLIDQFLQHAVEVDVDALCDKQDVFITGILEHIEEAGVHSGDSACILPPANISEKLINEITETTRKIALELNVLGLINIQYAIYENELYVIEVNPRASRTVPFISKAIGIPIAKKATEIIMGKTLKELNLIDKPKFDLYYVKEVVLPFKKFAGTDTILGPEMKSTGEVMGIGKTPSEAFFKSQEASGQTLPLKGNVFISVSDTAKKYLIKPLNAIVKSGYVIYATEGTHNFLKNNNIKSIRVSKVYESRPNIVDLIKSGKINIVLNIPTDIQTRNDALEIRLSALRYNVPYFTTIEAAAQAFAGIVEMQNSSIEVYPLRKNKI
ncbi:MAG: carbamoyl-phosphate synthase large subunit [Spirochaetia bacterium]|nr:carbamoyl-phosphate synthase large subunit [Spirochaetia bacterium]